MTPSNPPPNRSGNAPLQAGDAPCRRNIEVKVRVQDLVPYRRLAEQLTERRLPDQQQVDTYFVCGRGRLKLREINGQDAELIWYQRADAPTARESSYRRVPIAAGEGLRRALGDALGILCVVRKLRQIWLYQNIRIHLDQVSGLGTFLELESVVDADCPEATARQRLADLCTLLTLPTGGYIASSYSDLLLEHGPSTSSSGPFQGEL